MSCYVKSQGNTVDVSSTWTHCVGSSSCCVKGDECLPDGMCYSFPNNTNKLDYYPAGCQNNNFNNGCTSYCSNEAAPALSQWNSNNNTWTCCSRGNLGQPSCGTGNLGENYRGPWSQPDYNNYVYHVNRLSTGIIIGIVVAGVVVLGLMAFFLWRCCCSRRARDRRTRGKFVPLGSGRDANADSVVWNSNMHDPGHELQEGPMGGYAPPPGPPPGGPGMPPQYTVHDFRSK